MSATSLAVTRFYRRTPSQSDLRGLGVLRDPAVSSGTAQYGAIQSVAPSLGAEVSPINLRESPEIERGVAAFARSANGGLIVTTSTLATGLKTLQTNNL